MLVDPWLVGQLTFGGLSWVYAGNKKGPKLDPQAIAAGVDFMLITQASGYRQHACRPDAPRCRRVAWFLPVHVGRSAGTTFVSSATPWPWPARSGCIA